MITPRVYQQFTDKTQIYRESANTFIFTAPVSEVKKLIHIMYVALGIGGEAGEVLDLVKKTFRDPENSINNPEFHEKLKKELGDLMWYIAQMCNELEFDMNEVMEENLKKLKDRKERGVLSGSGDDR